MLLCNYSLPISLVIPPVLILAIETSTRFTSLALLEGDHLLEQLQLGTPTSRELAPILSETLKKQDIQPAELDLIGVSQGPGSFTGLRIGVVTAKTLSYATKTPVVAVDTLDVLAQQANVENRLWAILDAQRQELFAASYRTNTSGDRLQQTPTRVWPLQEWLDQVDRSDFVIGPAISRIRSELATRNISLVPETQWIPQAKTVGQLASKFFSTQGGVDIWKLTPKYYRRSAAEEKLREP